MKKHVVASAALAAAFFGCVGSASAGTTWRVKNVEELVQAVTELNALVKPDYLNGQPQRIEIEPGVYDLSEVKMSDTSHLSVDYSTYALTIVGLGEKPGDVVLKGGGAEKKLRVLYVTGGGNYGWANVTNLTVTGGYALGSGGGINAYNVRVRYYDLIVSNNVATVPAGTSDRRWTGCGGGICNGTAIGCTFADNSAEIAGGGFFTGGAHHMGYVPYVDRCTFSNNQQTAGYGAYYGGGALCSYGPVSNCTFVSNRAVYGGAFGLTDSTGASKGLYNCTFRNNVSTYDGGAVFKASVVDSNCTFVCNSGRYGGAVYLTPDVRNSVFEGNSSSYGGGVYGNSSTVINGCTFTTNSASTQGGAVYDCAAMTNCVFTGNSTVGNSGGAVLLSTSAVNVGVVACAFTNNSNGAEQGGALSGVTPLIAGCDFYANTNKFNNGNYAGGGAINLTAATFVTNCTFALNSCIGKGGDIRVRTDGTVVVDSKFYGSHAASSGSGAVVDVKVFNEETYYPVVFRDCLFTGSSRSTYAVGQRCDFYGCRFSGITATGFIVYNSNLYNCIFENCTGSGANAHLDSASDASVYKSVNTVYSGNRNLTYAFIIRNKTLYNCTVVSNTADSCRYGGIMHEVPAVNCLFAGNYQSAWCDVKYKYQDDGNDDVPHLTNCVYTTSDNLTGHDQYMKDCQKVAASRVRFLDDPARPFAPARRSAARNFGLTEPWLLALVGEKDVYGQPRLYDGRIDAGAAECQEDAPGALILLR